MPDTIKELQIGLIQDLVKFEQTDMTEYQLNKIEETYSNIYVVLQNLDKE